MSSGDFPHEISFRLLLGADGKPRYAFCPVIVDGTDLVRVACYPLEGPGSSGIRTKLEFLERPWPQYRDALRLVYRLTEVMKVPDAEGE